MRRFSETDLEYCWFAQSEFKSGEVGDNGVTKPSPGANSDRLVQFFVTTCWRGVFGGGLGATGDACNSNAR
jgi:hypothetical protein